MQKMQSKVVGFIFLLFILFLYSCAQNLAYVFNSSAETNGGNPFPVRIYQLADVQKFQEISYEDLYKEEDNDVLSSDIIGDKLEITLIPGENQVKQNIKIDKTVSYIGVAAFVMDYNNKTWRKVLSLPEKKINQLTTDLQLVLSFDINGIQSLQINPISKF